MRTILDFKTDPGKYSPLCGPLTTGVLSAALAGNKADALLIDAMGIVDVGFAVRTFNKSFTIRTERTRTKLSAKQERWLTWLDTATSRDDVEQRGFIGSLLGMEVYTDAFLPIEQWFLPCRAQLIWAN